MQVVAGTHVPGGNLFNYLARGDSTDTFLFGFPTVSNRQILDLLGSLPVRGLAAWLHTLPHKFSHLTQIASMQAAADRMQDETEERLHYNFAAMARDAEEHRER